MKTLSSFGYCVLMTIPRLLMISIWDDRIASNGYESIPPASSATNAFANLESKLSLLYASGVKSLSLILQVTSLLKILNAGSSSSINKGLLFRIFRTASFTSEDCASVGATEKYLPNPTPVSINKIMITAQ